PADRGGQVAKRVGQLVRRHRPLDRDGTPELAVAAGYDVEDLAAQETLGFDPHLGAVPETNFLVDVELDQHTRSVEFNAGHLSHRKAGDLAAVAGPQPARVGEIGGDAFALVDEGQVLVIQRGQYKPADRHKADSADDQRVAFREGFHFGVHRPVA